MASKRCGIVLVLVELTSFVGAQEFSETSSNANDVLGWNGGAQVDQPVVFPGPIAEPWVPREVIAATLERMCSITCQAGNDKDRKGFCAVYSTLVRLTSTNFSYTDEDMEKVEKKCLDACKKVRKENNSHKEARKKMCKAYGIYSHTMTLPAKCSSEGLDCSTVAGIPEDMIPSVVKDLMGSNGWDANDDGKVTREDAETIGGKYPTLFEEIKDLYSKDDELITYEDMAMYIGCEKKEYVPLAI